jgi:hypothetical protein
MTSMVVAVLVSFLVGSFGYVVVHFCIRPISRYRTIRKQVIQNLADYLNSFDQADEGENFHGIVDQKAAHIRSHSSDLTECYHTILPNWYQALLRGRGEYPEEISKHLMALSNTRDYYHARNRMEKIRQLFKA